MMRLAALWMEILLAIAMLTCCFEYFLIRDEFKSQGLFAGQSKSSSSYSGFILILILMAVSCCVLPFFPAVIGILFFCELYFVYRFNGPFNGGSGYMSFALLLGLCIYEYAPATEVKSISLLYVGVQCLLSFFVAGVVKVINPDWRSGVELRKIMWLPPYAVPTLFKSIFSSPKFSRVASWIIILFEVGIVVGFLNSTAAQAIILLALIFNFFNLVAFGLNRFLLFWMAAYPALYYCFFTVGQ